ncbi:ketoacyl-ACP synthase III [Alphaproteobacteria bacterium]|nr:ketoacyl-ACP synthase III [Alphaproteobacteria bacterium]
MTRIASIHYLLGGKKESLKDICQENPDWNYEKLFSKTGINNRHILREDETPEDLSFKAAKLCLDKCENKNIDGVLYVSQSPTNPLPTRACLLQDKLGITKNSLAFDINQGCSGFVYSLSLATSLIQNDLAERILIICSDHYSKYISKNDRTCRPIFSDAAAATIVEKSNKQKIGPFIFKTDGSGGKHLMVKNKISKPNLHMNGPAVLKFSLDLVPQATQELLQKASLTKEDISLFLFHQASGVVLNKLRNKLNIDENKWFMDIKNLGNTVSATIPIAINTLKQNGKFPENSNVCLMGFGVGLSVAGCIIT